MKTKIRKPTNITRKYNADKLEKEFNRILLEAVDETLDTLGIGVKKALYFHLKTAFSIKKETIYKDPVKFSDGLERIFGPGARFIENMVIESVCNKTRCKLRRGWQKNSFTENIEKIKEKFVEKNQN